MLEARGIDIAHCAFEVLQKVDLTIAEGRIVGLFGHNGAGKSSLLKGLYGVLPVRAGKVTFLGQDITGQKPFRQAERGIRLVPQEGNVFANLSVEDNLRMGALRLEGDKALHAARFGEIYGTFPILHQRRNAKARVLSGGERQMLAISIALMTRPKLLLLDEPSAGLAPILVQRMFEMVATIRQRFGMAVVLVEQNVNEALRVVDDVVVLEEGRIVFSGTATQKDLIIRHLWRLEGKSA